MATPLELVQTVYAAFGRGDVPGLLEHLGNDIAWTFEGSTGEPYMRTAHGKEDVMRWFGQVMEADDIQAFEPREFLAGPDHVTVFGWERCVARRSGKHFESTWIHVWRTQGGRVVRFDGMFDTAAAQRARQV